MQRVWKCSYLNTSSKIHLYQALVMSVLLYSAETWTLLSADVKTLDAFLMKCQQEAPLPQRNSASAAHIYLGWLADLLMITHSRLVVQ